MIPLQWLRVDVDFHDHPKALQLGRLLGNPLAWAYVQLVWAWCHRHARDGLIRACGACSADVMVEQAIGWKGRPGVFVRAALSVNLLERRGRNLYVHDWPEHQGNAIKRLETDALRKRRDRRRARLRAKKEGLASAGPSEDCPRPVRANQTKPNQTKPNRTTSFASSPPPPPSPSAGAVVVVDEKAFWEGVQQHRAERRVLRYGSKPKNLSAWLAAVSAEVGPIDTLERLLCAYERFLMDKNFADRAWPFQLFMARGVWTHRVPAPHAA